MTLKPSVVLSSALLRAGACCHAPARARAAYLHLGVFGVGVLFAFPLARGLAR